MKIPQQKIDDMSSQIYDMVQLILERYGFEGVKTDGIAYSTQLAFEEACKDTE